MLVTLHDVKTSTDWPPDIIDFAQTICRPLPSSFVPHLHSVHSFQQFSRATLSACTIGPEHDLLQLADVAALTVNDLQYLFHHRTCEDAAYSNRLPIYTLMKVVARLLDPSLTVTMNTHFITPRGSSTLEGVAVAVASLVISKEDLPWRQQEAVTTQSEMLSTTQSEIEDEEYPWDLDTEALAKYEEKHRTLQKPLAVPQRRFEGWGPFLRIVNTAVPAEEPPIDLPPDAHFDYVPGRRLSAMLPILAVADSENISTLLSSILYQRHAWGMNLPAVGLCLSDMSPIGRLCLGWLDVNAMNEAGLPQVHIAMVTDIQDFIPGVFDIGTMGGTLSFIQLFWSLREQIRAVSEASKSNTPSSFVWRSDNISIDETSHTDRIAKWVRDIDTNLQEPSGPPDSIPPTSPTSPLAAGDLDMARSESTPSSKAQSATGGPSTPVGNASQSHAIPQVFTPPSSQNLTIPSINAPRQKAGSSGRASATRIQAVQSAPSHSGLAKVDGESIIEQTMAAFLFDRNVVLVARRATEGLPRNVLKAMGTRRKVMKRMRDTYDAMTAFAWPANWAKDPERSLPLLLPFTAMRKTLCDQYQALPQDIKDKKHGPKDEKVLRIIESRLLIVILASLGQFTKEAILRGLVTVNEAEARHDWINLFSHLYVDEEQSYSPNVFLERKLQTCRNIHFDVSAKTADLDQWRRKILNCAQTQYTLCMGEVALASREAIGVPPEWEEDRNWRGDTEDAVDSNLSEADEEYETDEQGSLSDASPDSKDREALEQAALRATYEASLARDYKTYTTKCDAEEYQKLIQARTVHEPFSGICDAIIIDTFDWGPEDAEIKERYREYIEPEFNSHLKRQDEGQGLVIGLKTFKASLEAGGGGKKSRAGSPQPTANAKRWTSPLADTEAPSEMAKDLNTAKETFGYEKAFQGGPPEPFPPNINAPPTATEAVRQIKPQVEGKFPSVHEPWKAVMFAEFKRRDDLSGRQATNQARSYMCSALNFYAALRIFNHPVWTVITNGARGAVVMAWKSEDGMTYIMERDVYVFDISVPLQAYQFALFIIRLRVWANDQREKFANKIRKRFQDAKEIPKWTKEAQALQYFEIHNPRAFEKEQQAGTGQ